MILAPALLLLLSPVAFAAEPGPAGGGAFISALREVLQEDHADVRDPVWILAASGFNPATVVAELAKLLPGLDAASAVEAVYMLGRLGDAASAAVPALTERLLAAAEPDVRHGAARALARIGPAARPALSALAAASADSSADVRAAVAGALNEIARDAPAARAALKRLAKDADPVVRAEAERALTR